MLKDFFYFTRTERTGILVLLGFGLLGVFLPEFLILFQKSEKVDFSKAELLLEQMNNHTAFQDEKDQLFEFDPNTISLDSLKRLSLPDWLAKRIIKYRKKVGPFEKAADLLKVYGMKDTEFERLKPFVSIKKTTSSIAQYAKLSRKDAFSWSNDSFPKKEHKQIEKSYKPDSLFSFDPNICSEEALLRLGIPERTARTLLNFRNKGGTFRTKEDLKKVYGIDEEIYLRLESFIQISSITQNQSDRDSVWQKNKPLSYSKREPIIIDINTASEEEWQKLRGIGPYYAGRIVRFREVLGGFLSIEQVAETYRLPDSTFQKILPFLQHSPIYRKIMINEVSEEDLKKHPYINYRQAGALIAFREQHGPFENLEELKALKVFSNEELEKILPYLEIVQE